MRMRARKVGLSKEMESQMNATSQAKPVLNAETAANYIRAVAGEPVRIISATSIEMDGIPAVSVAFEARGFTFTADVWIEAGRIYGEW